MLRQWVKGIKFHGQKLLDLLAIWCNSVWQPQLRLWHLRYGCSFSRFAYIENIHFLFFFFKYCVRVYMYIYIYFFLVHLFLSSRAERNYGWKGIEVSVAFKKSLRKERWPSCDTFHWYLVFPRNALDINETEFHFNRNDEISIRFPGWKQDPILLLTMFA